MRTQHDTHGQVDDSAEKPGRDSGKIEKERRETDVTMRSDLDEEGNRMDVEVSRDVANSDDTIGIFVTWPGSETISGI